MTKFKLTGTGKAVIFVIFAVLVIGVVYGLGGFNFLKDKGASNQVTNVDPISSNSSEPQKSSSSNNTMNISLDEWVGWKSIIDANGGLKTKSGSIYDKLGLNLNISVINDGSQSSNALIKGDLDGAGYTVNRYSFLYPKFKENGIQPVMPYITNFSTGGDGIISKSSINGIEGLAGKKIAVPRYSEAQTLVWWLMNHSGLTDAEIKQIEKSMVMFDTPDDAAKAFFAGQVDAAATWQPYLTQAQDTTGAKLLFSTKSATNIVLDGVVFDKKYYDSHKDLVAKFIEGSLQASTLYATETTSIKNTFDLFATETDENIKAMTSDATLATYADNVKLIGDEAQTLFVDMSNIWKNLGEKSSAEEVKNAFDTSALDLLKDKYSTEEVKVVKVTEEQRDQAKQQTDVQALLKKSVTINFQPNSAAFLNQEEAAKALQTFVDTAKILNGAIIQIEGNIADTGVGSTEAGKKLSEQRAKAVATYLQYQGVDPTRFVIIGNGISKQTGDNKTTEGQAKNRRTDIFFKMVE